MYGIPNCDTTKKARKWLEENNVNYTFHNYKKDGVPERKLKKWIRSVGWEMLLNKRGTTWRKLDKDIKESVNEESALKIMLNYPSIIKRPILEHGKNIIIGFAENEYKNLS